MFGNRWTFVGPYPDGGIVFWFDGMPIAIREGYTVDTARELCQALNERGYIPG